MKFLILFFVAGSLVKKIGGHNPIEAASLGKAVIMGPYTEKCDAQINDLVWSGGAIKIENSTEFKNVFMVSAKKGQGCKDLIDFLQTAVPNSPFLYDKDQLTDLPEGVLAAEITREKLFNYLNSELPYNLFVETFIWKEKKNSITIHQNINVSKYNHKRTRIDKSFKIF